MISDDNSAQAELIYEFVSRYTRAIFSLQFEERHASAQSAYKKALGELSAQICSRFAPGYTDSVIAAAHSRGERVFFAPAVKIFQAVATEMNTGHPKKENYFLPISLSPEQVYGKALLHRRDIEDFVRAVLSTPTQMLGV